MRGQSTATLGESNGFPYKNMAYVKGSPTRPHPAPRNSLHAPVPKFPPLNNNYEGIYGSAMAVPPPRPIVERDESRNGRIHTGSPTRSLISSRSESVSLKSVEDERLREAKEAAVGVLDLGSLTSLDLISLLRFSCGRSS